MKVYAPNKGYSGISAGVTFVNGVGETDRAHLLEWFQEKGYQIERQDHSVQEQTTVQTEEFERLHDMDEDALKAFAEENDIRIGNATSQAGILKKIRAALSEGGM